MKRRTFVVSSLALAAHSAGAFGTDINLASWPRGRSPREIGERVAKRYIAMPLPAPIMFDGVMTTPEHIGYWESCAWYGGLTFAETVGDEWLMGELRARFDQLLGLKENLIPAKMTLHYPAFAAVPFQLYLQTGNARYLSIGAKLADKQWAPPTAPEGLSSQPRHWIVDEAYLIAIPQLQAFRATGNSTYLDRAAREMVAYLDKLQQPSGLFHHSPKAPLFWARGNGWAAAGMAELLRSLPKEHPDRSRILSSYRRLMAVLLEHQGDNGLWRQLIDDPEAWFETSSTGMFTFALVTGLKEGWLDAHTYIAAARNAWLGLTDHINAQGEIDEVCEGTWMSNDRNYYLNRKRSTGDLHGQASVLWSATALSR